MTTLRTHLTIKRSVDDVWSVVSDAAAIAAWFPMVQTSSVDGAQRYCQLTGGIPIFEKIVTNDPELRRFQYRIDGGGVPVTSHLGTVDVLDVDGSTEVVYSTEVTPDSLAGLLGPAVEDGLRGLKTHCESK